VCSDPGVVQWDGDEPVCGVNKPSRDDEQEPKSFQGSERSDLNRSDVEFTLAVDEDSSDDCHADKVARRYDVGQSAIDIWMEKTSREMNSASDKSNVDLLGDLSYDTTLRDPPETQLITLMDPPAKIEATSETIIAQSDPVAKDRSQTAADKNIISVPELGTFRRKRNFKGLATTQLITMMLAQSMFLLTI
jgi:hypothetical protein